MEVSMLEEGDLVNGMCSLMKKIPGSPGIQGKDHSVCVRGGDSGKSSPKGLVLTAKPSLKEPK